jgi:hypothetical protein
VGQAIEAWIAVAQSDLALTLSWIRDLPSLGSDARHLQREWLEALRRADPGPQRHPGVACRWRCPPWRQLALMLIGGLRELIATAGDGGDVSDITEAAVQATQALPGPRGRAVR